MAPRKGTPAKPAATPARVMTRPSALRNNLPTAATPSNTKQSSTIDEDTEASTPSPSSTKAKAKRKTPAKPKTAPAISKATPAKSKAKTPAKGNTKAKTPGRSQVASADQIGKGRPKDVLQIDDDGSAQVGSSASSSPLSSVQSEAASSAPKANKAKAGRRKLPSADRTYKDVAASEDEMAAVPKAKAVTGGKRKVTFDEKSYREGELPEEAEDEYLVQQRRPPKRKAKAVEDQVYQYEEEEDDNNDQNDEPEDLDDLFGDAEIVQSVERSEDREAIAAATASASPRSPKRQRTRSPSAAGLANTGNSSSRPANDDTEASNDPIRAARDLFSKIENAPRTLQLSEISALFMVLQEEISVFCKRHFNFDLTFQQKKAWPLHQLATKYKMLLKVTQFIADGSACGWRSFFTKKEHRRHLVHGIVGEWLLHKVFKHTAFGVRRDLLEDLEDIDHEYLRYDAFVRNKKKAKIMEGSRCGDDSDYKFDSSKFGYFPIGDDNEVSADVTYEQDADLAARKLANSIMEVLEPLLPPSCFDPLASSRGQSTNTSDEAARVRHLIHFGLFELIKKAAALHHCIRFSGRTGLVVRITPHIPKGTMFTVDDSNRNICVNATELNNSPSRPTGPNPQLEVKMTCFGRVEAIMPAGLDLEELEREIQASNAVGSPLTIEEGERKLFPKLPYELQTTGEGRNAVAHLNPVPGTEWNAALHQENLENNVNREFNRDTTPVMQGAQPDRHPYVTIYPRIAPSNLYCEWAQSPQDPALFPRAAQTPKGQSLREAVQEACLEHPMSSKLQGAWYAVTDSPLSEWALLGGLLATSGVFASWLFTRALNSPTVQAVVDPGVTRVNEVYSAISSRRSEVFSAISSRRGDAISYLSGLVASHAATTSTAAASIAAVTTSTVTELATATATPMEVDEPSISDSATTKTITDLDRSAYFASLIDLGVLQAGAPLPDLTLEGAGNAADPEPTPTPVKRSKVL